MPPYRAAVAALALACIAAFVALAHPPWPAWPLASLDVRVFATLQAARSDAGDAIFQAVTRLGDKGVVAVVTSAAAIALIAARRVRDACLLLVAAALAGYASAELKELFERGRPLAPQNLGSFPSSHATLATTLYVSIAWLAAVRLRRRASRIIVMAAAIAVASLVGLSRLYLGAHWLGDVLAGHALGGAIALLLVAASAPPARCDLSGSPRPS